MRVISVSTLYPSPSAPGRGLFVRHRLQEAAKRCNLHAIVPISVWETRRDDWKPTGQWQDDGAVRTSYIPWYVIPGMASFAPPLLSRQLLRWISSKGLPADLLDAQFGYPDGPSIARVAAHLGLPYTITLRGSEVVHAQSAVRRRALRRAFERASAVIAVSEKLRDFAVSLGASRERSFLVPNGVDQNVFFPGVRESERKRWLRDRSELLVVAAGNLIELKGFHNLVTATKGLRDDGLNVRLIIAGQGGFDREYERRLKNLPLTLSIAQYVTFCGRLEQGDLCSLMNAADLFVLSSTREGWPNVLHEALACGTPAVATDVGAVRDLIRDSRFGLVVAPGNPDELTSSVKRALGQSWIRPAISEWASSRSWGRAADELVEVWRNCILRL